MASINDIEKLTVPFSSLLQFPTLVASLFLLFVTVSAAMFSRRARYPPGPSALPLIGHTFSIPIEKPWLYFDQLGRRYGPLSFIFFRPIPQYIALSGPVVRLSLAGDEVLVLNRAEDAKELVRLSYTHNSHKLVSS